MTTLCCVCGRIKMDDGWQKENGRQDKIVSHGYCQKCYEITLKKCRAVRSGLYSSESLHLHSQDAGAAPVVFARNEVEQFDAVKFVF